MRIVVQRASTAEVVVESKVVGRLPSPGLVLLVGITHADTEAIADKLAKKVWDMRILEDSDPAHEGTSTRPDVSASDIDAPMLVISQFTLYADTRKGRRPSWDAAAKAEIAKPLFDYFAAALIKLGAHVETGVFGAMMEVSLTNDGPVTVILEA